MERIRLRPALLGLHHVALCRRCERLFSVLATADHNVLPSRLASMCPDCEEELEPDSQTLYAAIRFEEDDEMSTATQEELINLVLSSVLDAEGGYVDHPNDHGGPTNHGITLPTLTDYIGHPATIEDLKALTVDDARKVLRALFVERPGFLEIRNSYLFHLLVDAAVNHGPTRPIKWLQLAVGADTDGILGPDTLAKVKNADTGRIARRVLAERARKYGRIITNEPSQVTFAAGWANRLADFIERLP